MAISVLSCGYIGLDSYVVEVEVDVSNGLPIFNIVGMGDLAILESKERVRSCFKNIGVEFPIKRVLVNLSPADIKKKGSHFDLSIAVGILANIGKIRKLDILKNYIVMGEISLNGDIKSCSGIINATILAKEKKLKGIIIPYENYYEASLISDVEIIPVRNLNELIELDTLLDSRENIKLEKAPNLEKEDKENIDFMDVKGQILAKRALEIAAAGGHNLLMVGDPGSGKSMLAKRFSTILPKMTEKEIIETTKIYSVSGMLTRENPIITERPFRTPHHTISQVALIGGAQRAGELTLALNGVIFLDELAEFTVRTLEVLRQPLEDGKITVSRANIIVTYPINTILIAASNPTPGGYFVDNILCKDSLKDIKSYQKKFSGPLLDRIDLYVEMRRLEKNEIFDIKKGESSESIKERVEKSREIQRQRFGNDSILNAKMNGNQIEKYCQIDEKTKLIFEQAIEELQLSVRVYDKILKISRTIADLDTSENIELTHLVEALNYRRKY